MKNRETLSYLHESMKGKRHHIVILSVIQVFLGLLTVSFAFLLKFVVKGLENQDQHLFLMSLYFMIGAAVLMVVLQCLYRYLWEIGVSDIENALKARLYHDLIYSDYEEVKRLHEEDWINRLTSDTSVVASATLSILPNLIRMLLQLIAAVSLIIYLYPKFGYFLFPVIAALLVLTYFMRKRLKKYHKAVQEADGRLKIFYSETFQGLSVIHTFLSQEVMEEKEEERLLDHKKARVRKNNFSNLCNIGYVAVYYASYLLGLLFCGLSILNGTMDIATLTTVLALLTQVQGPLGNITGIIPKYYALIASGERLRILSSDPRKKERNPLIEDYYSSSFQGLEGKDISFSYQGENGNEVSVFTDFSFSIKKGQFIALKGESGKGKSTLMKLILGLYHLKGGEISIEDKEGSHPISASDLSLFGYVPQDNLLLQGTIKENITFFSKDVDEERLERALALSCSSSFVNEMKDKENTMLKEKGSGLSLGQIQRLSIARALYFDAPILLLDECTSALDIETESQVMENLKSLKNKTVLMITHHPALLSYADQILDLGEKHHD